MAEILTESFCERCGTRYTFESAAPRTAKLKGIRVLSRGFKNFVMSDDTSMDEAMAAARSETDREATSQQLDAFHKTFNFCMSCRQYTCANCWNEAEGRCLTCAPHLGHEILPAPFPDLGAGSGSAFGKGAGTGHGIDATNGHALADPTEALAWPTMDLERDDDTTAAEDAHAAIEPIDASARLAALGAIEGLALEPVGVADLDAVADDAIDVDAVDGAGQDQGPASAEPEIGASAEPEVGASAAAASPPFTQDETEASPGGLFPADVPGRAAAAAAQTASLLRRFRPGQSLDAEIEAYERDQSHVVAVPDALDAAVPDALDAAAIADSPVPTETIAEWLPDSIVDRPPVAEEIAVEAAPSADDAVAASAPNEDVVEQPTWRIVAPEAAAPPIAPSTAPQNQPASATAEPQWPAKPEWPTAGRAAAGLPFLGRPAQPTGTLESLWAESAREVVSTPAPLTLGGASARPAGGVQPCISCGLSLSATARFCRRCGSSQV